ncbi:MAG: hypothetical protein ACXVHK_23300, partial [Solirubrobacteraceae bacterium]
ALAAAVEHDGDELRQLLHEAVAERLRLDSERGKLERRILTLAARAEDTDAAQELRRLWLRHRTLTAQLAELRRLISEARRRLER